MKRIQLIIFSFTVILFLGCSNKDFGVSEIQDCSQFMDAKILEEEEGCCAVLGYAIFAYENELYGVQGFCSCDEFILSTTPKPVNCDGIELCAEENEFDNIQDCLSELRFYEKAEFLFNITLE